MIDITIWMGELIKRLQNAFGNRIWFAGIQGSYARGEASESSDLDVVVILDELVASDIQIYHTLLETMPHRDLICGFLSGKNEILNWDPSDLFQFYHDTKPVIGSLDALLPMIDENAVRRAIKIGVCNIYHGCVHNMLHEKSEEILRSMYKSASFVVQAIVYLKTGSYIRCKRDLLAMAAPPEKTIIELFMSLKDGGEVHFQEMSEILFSWAKTWINMKKTDL